MAENTRYTAYILTDKKKYNVTNAIVSISTSEEEKQIAMSVNLGLMDVDVDGEKLSDIIQLRHRVILNASDGEKTEEVYQGYVWSTSPKESLTDDELSIGSYDQLIYWQESEDAVFFPAGEYTTQIFKSICEKWGIKYIYEYGSIAHGNLLLRGAISDFLTADLLDTVKKSVGKAYVIRSEKDSVAVRYTGSNQTVYAINEKQNAIELRRYKSLNGVVTKAVVISISDDDKTSVEASASNNTAEYGTLQKIVLKDESTTLGESLKEAENIVKEKGNPQWEYDIKAVDIPWIRKGDSVDVNIGTLKGRFIVKSISREISNRGNVMTLTVA